MTESVLSRLSPMAVYRRISATSPRNSAIRHRNTDRSVGYIMLDCSGTTMDRYVDAPAIVFVEVFKNYESRSRCPRPVARWACARICTSRP